MYKAITDRIIVKLCDCSKNTQILGFETKERNRGTVLDVGPNVSGVCNGDEIIFHTFDELPLPKENLVVIREKSVLGIIENDDNKNRKENLCQNKI